ncbi:hypothetical protein PCANC_18766 [Puccinia coronata f. sp. avenae]|uniref:NADH dehydrogenase [ubiquinone] iron-sulfur protein 4, mitochondrial n=1 Tax=Puccinia coronata f. sp. avenae TaxID=200324 RepID=A0A2N5UEB4_9BASI|nr:hypothetical protein PCANC_18766 [Puccinia coronata f. sp. avenae]
MIAQVLRTRPAQLASINRYKRATQALRIACYSDNTGRQLTPTPNDSAKTEHGVQPATSGDSPVIPAGMTSGAPEQLALRPVRIYRPSPTTMQSAKANNHTWLLDWDTLQGAGRWENPLMGWASTADYLQGSSIKFKSSEAAVAFCEKQGWNYFVQAPKEIKFKPKSYSDNYLYSDSKLRIHKTK